MLNVCIGTMEVIFPFSFLIIYEVCVYVVFSIILYLWYSIIQIMLKELVLCSICVLFEFSLLQHVIRHYLVSVFVRTYVITAIVNCVRVHLMIIMKFNSLKNFYLCLLRLCGTWCYQEYIVKNSVINVAKLKTDQFALVHV